MEQAHVTQVGLVSSKRYLNKIVSSNQNTPVIQGESVVLGLATCQAPEDQNSGIHFTHLKMRNQDLPSFDVPPYVNFLKNGFVFGKDGAKIESGEDFNSKEAEIVNSVDYLLVSCVNSVDF